MWQKFIDSFHASHVIFFARVQTLCGTVWVVAEVALHVLHNTDMSALLDPKHLAYWNIASGLAFELLRRYKAEDDF